ncbi:MAG: lipopolysaccharide biosynthesis protein [Candidatus Eisenbacteria bacterium]|nr:lipopolysaccharide biosynthesis protein [Candidatus Eisenbacteria bacterium]
MSRLGRNSAALMFAVLSSGLLGWLQLKWLAVHLGAAGLGSFAVLFSCGSVLTLLVQSGRALLVTRWVAALEADGRPAPAARLALASFAATAVSGVAACVAAFGLPAALEGAWAPLAGTRAALPWVALFFAATAARGVLYSVWNGRRRMERPALVEMLQLTSVTLRLYAGPPLDLAGFFLWNAGTSLMATAICAAWILPGVVKTAFGSDGGRLEPAESREVRSYGAWSLLVSATGIGFDYADRLVVAERLGALDVSFFHVPARWLQFVRRLLAQPLSALFPELARGPLGERRAAFHAFVEISSLMSLGAGLALALSPGAFIRLLASPAFDRGIPILRVLALVPPLMALYAPLTTALRAGGSMRQGAVSDLVWVGTYLGFGALALGRMGALGLAAGQVIASLAALAWNLRAGRAQDRMGLPWAALARQWALAAVALGAGWLAPGGETGWWRALLGCAVFAAAAGPLGAISPAARTQIRSRLPERMRPVFSRLAGS